MECPDGSKNLECGEKKNMGQDEPFILLGNTEIQSAIQILKLRLPRSAPIYNMALLTSKFSDIKTYSLNGDLSENAVFVLIYIRPDFDQDINISVPLDFVASESVKQAFITTSLIDWDSRYWFPVLDRLVSRMILDISTIDKKNATITNPIYCYCMSQEDAKNLKLKIQPEIEVKPVDTKDGVDLIVHGWKFSKAGTSEFVEECVEKGFSSGVYVDGIPVCGMMENKNGFVGMLYTDRKHRNKGYARTCAHFLMKQLGMNDHAIVSGVECRNVASAEFHKKIGLTFSHYADDVIYEPEDFDH